MPTLRSRAGRKKGLMRRSRPCKKGAQSHPQPSLLLVADGGRGSWKQQEERESRGPVDCFRVPSQILAPCPVLLYLPCHCVLKEQETSRSPLVGEHGSQEDLDQTTCLPSPFPPPSTQECGSGCAESRVLQFPKPLWKSTDPEGKVDLSLAFPFPLWPQCYSEDLATERPALVLGTGEERAPVSRPW